MAEVRQATTVAAKWWADTIANPTPNSFCNGDRKSDSSFMIMMMAHMRAMKNAATKEQLEQFCNLLAQRIEDELSKTSRVELDCDYGPNNILGETAEEVGIATCLFPFKRRMTVTTDSVEVKDGYDANWVQLYPAKAE